MKTRLLTFALTAAVLLSLALPMEVAAQAAQTICPLPDTEAIGVDPDLEVAFVPNRRENTVSVIKVSPIDGSCFLQTVRVIELPFGESPTSVFIHPDKRTGFVIVSENNVLSVFDARSGEVNYDIPIAVGSGALAGAMHPSGHWVYVSNLLLGSVTVVDTRPETPPESRSWTVPLPPSPFPLSIVVPIGAAVNPDGDQLWVTTTSSHTVEVFDIDYDPDPASGGGSGALTHDRQIEFPFVPIANVDLALTQLPLPVDITFDAAGVAHVVTLGRKDDPALSFFQPQGGNPVDGFIWPSAPDAYFRIGPDDTDPTLISVGDFTTTPLGLGAAELVVANGDNPDSTVDDLIWITNAGALSSELPSVPLGPGDVVSMPDFPTYTDANGNEVDPNDLLGPPGLPLSDGPFSYTTHATTITSGGLQSRLDLPISPTPSESPVGLALSPLKTLVYMTNYTSNNLLIFDATSPATGALADIPVGLGPVTPFGADIALLPTEPEFTLDTPTGADPLSCNTSISATVGETISFNVLAATTAYFEDEAYLTLSAEFVNDLDDSVMTPSLDGGLSGIEIVSGPPEWQLEANSDFEWLVPFSAAGQGHSVKFTAEGAFGDIFDIPQPTCQVTINVAPVAEPEFTEPTDGHTFTVVAGKNLKFDVTLFSSTGREVTIDVDPSTPISNFPDATLTPWPASGTPEVTTTFKWKPTVADVGSSTQLTFIGEDEFGQPALPVSVWIDVVEPGAFVPFEPFLVTRLRLDRRPRHGNFDYRGAFGLGDASDGIDPLTEDVIIGFDGFSLTIPAGSFRKSGKNKYKFNGVVEGVRVNAELREPKSYGGHKHGKKCGHGRLWTFKFIGKKADLTGVENRVDASLQIGDDLGEKSVRARIKH